MTLAANWGDWMIGAFVLIVAVIAVLLWSMAAGVSRCATVSCGRATPTCRWS